MKKNDIALLILIAGISLGVAWFAGNAIIGEPKQSSAKVKVADTIDPTLVEPDKKIFNSAAINPRVDRSIGGSSDTLPLSEE